MRIRCGFTGSSFQCGLNPVTNLCSVDRPLEKALFASADHSMSALSTASMDRVILREEALYSTSRRSPTNASLCRHGGRTQLLDLARSSTKTHPWLLMLLALVTYVVGVSGRHSKL